MCFLCIVCRGADIPIQIPDILPSLKLDLIPSAKLVKQDQKTGAYTITTARKVRCEAINLRYRCRPEFQMKVKTRQVLLDKQPLICHPLASSEHIGICNWLTTY
jgi:hypothetical protein